MKKFYITLLVALLAPLAALAQSVTVNGIKYDINTETQTATVALRQATTLSGKITVAAQVGYNGKNYPVTAMASRSFFGCNRITQIVLPESITSMGIECFGECSALTSINIPQGMTSLPTGCFYACTALASIVVPEGVSALGNDCFLLCEKLTQVTLPESLTALPDNCFSSCFSLGSITVPESIQTVGNNCFAECNTLSSINLPHGTTWVGNNCFLSCWALRTLVCDAYNPPSLGTNVFQDVNKSNITLSIPAWSTELYQAANEWKDLNIVPYSVTAFEHMVGDLKYVTNLTAQTSQVATRQSTSLSGEVKIPTEIVFKGKTCKVTSLANECFYNCTQIIAFDIPVGITSIGSYAFQGCTGITDIVLPEGITTLKKIFSGNTNLAFVDLPKSLTQLESVGFFGALPELIQVTIPGVTIIPSNCFMRCPKLTRVEFAKNVTFFGERAFMDCTSLTSITVPNGVTDLRVSTFKGCTELIDVTLPSSLKTIGYEAFSYCDKLEKVTCYAVEPPTVKHDTWLNTPFRTATLLVPDGSVNKYRTADIWSSFGLIDVIPPPPVALGDVNADGSIDVTDTNIIVNMMLGKEGLLTSADIDGSGFIDVVDLNAVINLILSK